MEVDGGQGRGVRDVEGHGARLALAADVNAADLRPGEVVGEGVRQRLGAQARAVGDRVDAQRVASLGESAAVPVVAVEVRVAHGVFARGDEARVVVVQGLAGVLVGVLAHRVARGVLVGVGDALRRPQQPGDRSDRGGALRPRRGRHDVGVRVGGGSRGRGGVSGQRVHSEGNTRGRGGETRGHCVGLAAVGGEGVEDRNGTPVTVEAEEGDRQVGFPLGHRGQDRETVDEGAVGRVGVGVGGESSLRGDGHSRGDDAATRHGDRRGVSASTDVARVADRNTLVSPVGAVLGEDTGGDNLGESLRFQPVGACLVSGVGQANGERPTLGSVSEVGLGPGLVGCLHDGGEHGGGGGRHRVGQAGANLTRRIVGATAALVVDQGLRGSHEEVVDDARLFDLGHVGKTGVGLDALLDVGGHARQVGGRHGCAGGVAVGAARKRRPDVPAGGGDLGLEGQVGGHAPGGEARRFVGGRTPPVSVID